MDTSKLEETVNSILQSAAEKASQGAEFLEGQIPDVARQLLAWNLYKALVILAACAVVIGAGVWVARKWDSDDWCYTPLPALLAVATIGFPLVFIYFNALEAIQISVAPKVWLLEYAAQLVRR